MTETSPQSGLLQAFTDALASGAFVKMTLSKSRPAEGDQPVATQAFIRPVDIKKAPHISVLFRYPTKDITTNYPRARAVEVVGDLLRTRFANAHLFTTGADFELRTNKKGEARLAKHKPTFVETGSTEHNVVKKYVLDPANAPYLRELGIVTPEGHIRSDKADKYRQLQNIIKLLDQFVEKSDLRSKPSLRVVDMGCGKAYLTFAVYDYCNHHLGIPTEVLGVDQNAELMATTDQIARKLNYGGLTFRCSTVETLDVGEVDLLIALHACDTATDAALYKGIAAGASIVIAVPCCQKELRPQFKAPPSEQPMFKHDTFKDRYSQMLTDALRGLWMESQGYRTRVIEFISDAHTHRNVMIVSVRDPSFRQAEQKLAEAASLKERYRIGHQKLETLLIESGRIAQLSSPEAPLEASPEPSAADLA